MPHIFGTRMHMWEFARFEIDNLCRRVHSIEYEKT